MKKQPAPASGFFASYESLLTLRSIGPAEVYQQIEKGISKEQLMQLKDLISLSYKEMADLLGLTDRTLYLKKNGEIFSRSVSDRLYSLAYLYSFVYNSFLNKEKADKWMRRPFRPFRYKPPLELCNTNMGMLYVEEELKRLRMGIF